MKSNKFNIFRLLVLLTLIPLASCYNYREIGLLQDRNKSLPVYENIPYQEYRINYNDELVFRLITSDQTISTLIQSNQGVANTQNMISYRVFPDGTVDLPFLKKVPVVGMTLIDAAREIENGYKELIPDAAVKLTLANKHFTIIGDAGTGVYPIYRDKLTIYQALSMSGEINMSGNFKHVKILREENGKTKIMDFDIRPISVVNSKYYFIYPNDIVYISTDPSSFYKVNNYGSFIGLVTSSITLLVTVMYFLTK